MAQATEDEAKVIEQTSARPAAAWSDLPYRDLARPVLDGEEIAAQIRARRLALVLMVGSSVLTIALLGLAWSYLRQFL